MSEEEDYLDSTAKRTFFSGVEAFYKAVATTIINFFAFNDNVVDDVVFLLPGHQDNVTTFSVPHLTRFSAAVPQEAHEALEEETLDYMLLPSSVLPSVVNEEGKPIKSDEVCAYWKQIGMMTTPDGSARFRNLSQLAKCILTQPVSFC